MPKVKVPCPKCSAEQTVEMDGATRPTQLMSEDNRTFFKMVCLEPGCHHQFTVENRSDGRVMYTP